MKMLTTVGRGLIFFSPFSLSAISKFSMMTTSYLYNKKCTKYVYDRMVSRKREFKSWVQPYHKLIRTRPNIKKQNKKDGKGRKWTKRLSKLLGYELGIMSDFLFS